MKSLIFVALCLLLISTATAKPSAAKSAVKKKASSVVIKGGEDPDPIIRERRDFVAQMMKDAWEDYVKWAWGENALRPISQTGESDGIYGGAKIGATIVDSLSTMLIMEMTEEYELARSFVENELDFNQNATVSLFETNIRFVGGLLSAYALTQDPLYRDKAEDVATRLLPAFDTPTGIPYNNINLMTGEVQRNPDAVLAEFGTLHLEFMYLSDITGNPIFREKALAIRAAMKNAEKPKGLYWNYFDVNSGEFTINHVSIGALGDSFYEYLLKAAIQLNDAEAREMYDSAMDAFESNGLFKVSSPSNLLYIAESRNDEIQDRASHLACFAGGMFALGAHVDPDNANAERDAEIGRNFTNTCRESYIRTHTQIGPEAFVFTDTLEAEASFDGEKKYLLRPEVMESYFVLYRITGDPKYREWAWEATQAYEKYTKAGAGRGYSGIENIDHEQPRFDDMQQTFFLAETLKYLYLIFSTNDLISLDEWVFNTECHPLPIKSTNPLY